MGFPNSPVEPRVCKPRQMRVARWFVPLAVSEQQEILADVLGGDFTLFTYTSCFFRAEVNAGVQSSFKCRNVDAEKSSERSIAESAAMISDSGDESIASSNQYSTLGNSALVVRFAVIISAFEPLFFSVPFATAPSNVTCPVYLLPCSVTT